MDETDDQTEPEEEILTDEPAPETEMLGAFLKKWDRDLPPDRRHYGIKLLFAGAESKKVRDGLYRIGVRTILVSYFYLKKYLQTATIQELAEDLGRFDFVFLDSGGFTFIDAIRQGKDLGIDIKKYADQYYEDLPRFAHIFAGCAEVDVIDLGQEYMEEKKRQMLDKGVPIVPVVQGEPIEHYEAMGWWDLYPYIAIGSALIGDPRWVGYINQLYELGQQRGIVFHGLGATGAQTILRSRYYSVDSTSWTGGSRFGATMLFQNGRIRHYDNKHKDVRKRYKRRFEENGIIWADIEADKGFEVDMMNALAWKQWADYIKFSATKCYWLEPDERSVAMDLKSKAFNAEGVIDRSKSIARAGQRRLSLVTDPGYDDRAHETLQCDSCHMSGRCPRFKPSQPCGYDINIRMETQLDLQKALQIILEQEYGRVMTGLLFEKLEGGVLDGNVSKEMGNFIAMVQSVKGIFDPRGESITIKAQGGQGAVAQMLASVFSPKSSGNTLTERAANQLEESTNSLPLSDVIDAEVTEVETVEVGSDE